MKKIKIKKILFAVLFGVLLSGSLFVQAQVSAESIENPKSKGLTNWVSNQDKILSSKTVEELNNMINALYDSTSCQISVVVIKGDKQTNARDLSMELFERWQVGMKGKDNGLILLVVTEAHQCFFRTGYGLEDIITDAKSTRIFTEKMKPYFLENNWDEGVLQGTKEAASQIYKFYLNPKGASSEDDSDATSALYGFIFVYFLLGCGVFIFAVRDLNKCIANIEHTFRTKRVNTLKKSFNRYIAVETIFSIFTLPVYLIMYKNKVNSIRNEKVYCSCGNEMILLSEKEEDEFLNNVQQLEEELKSRNYDVWLCPKCGETEIFCYEENSQYEICPRCHAKAYKRISQKVTYSGTVKRYKTTTEEYFCENCHHRGTKTTTVEDNNDSAFIAGAAAGSVLGSMGRGHSGGFSGGFSGGSFGGGFSGGGGGGGSW